MSKRLTLAVGTMVILLAWAVIAIYPIYTISSILARWAFTFIDIDCKQNKVQYMFPGMYDVNYISSNHMAFDVALQFYHLMNKFIIQYHHSC